VSRYCTVLFLVRSELQLVSIVSATIESTKIIEWASEDTLISYQLHKRVWPTAQRESLFWSHIRHCTSDKDEGPDLWIVVNYSTAHDDAPVSIMLLALKD
jgi:collagen type IV alpha-3-binding protein